MFTKKQKYITGLIIAVIISIISVTVYSASKCIPKSSWTFVNVPLPMLPTGWEWCPTPTPTTSTNSTSIAAVPIGSISFWGDFESGVVIGAGNHNWRSIQAAATNRIGLVKASRGTYARVEVRSGDGGCSTCSERAEVLMMQDASSNPLYENTSSGTIQYKFSVMFPTTWRHMVGNSNGAWGIFLQLHGPDALGTNPAFAFDANDQIIFSMRTGDINVNKGSDFTLLNGNLNKGHWIDFILTVKYAKGNTGSVKIQRHDEGQSGYTTVLTLNNISTLQYKGSQAVGNHYMKHGLYRNRESFTGVLYIDNFTRTRIN